MVVRRSFNTRQSLWRKEQIAVANAYESSPQPDNTPDNNS